MSSSSDEDECPDLVEAEAADASSVGVASVARPVEEQLGQPTAGVDSGPALEGKQEAQVPWPARGDSSNASAVGAWDACSRVWVVHAFSVLTSCVAEACA